MWLWGIAIWLGLAAVAIALYVAGMWRFELRPKPPFTTQVILFIPRKPIRK